MQRYVAGDEAAFRALFERVAPQLLGMIRRQVSGCEANDLLQASFLQLHRARFDFRAGEPLRPWLFTIAANLVRQRHRRRSRKPECELLDRTADTLIAEDDDLAEREEARARRDRVRAALEKLPLRQREAIRLHWFEEHRFPRIAELVGASVGAVKVRAHRGYQRLRAELSSSPSQRTSSAGRGRFQITKSCSRSEPIGEPG